MAYPKERQLKSASSSSLYMQRTETGSSTRPRYALWLVDITFWDYGQQKWDHDYRIVAIFSNIMCHYIKKQDFS